MFCYMYMCVLLITTTVLSLRIDLLKKVSSFFLFFCSFAKFVCFVEWLIRRKNKTCMYAYIVNIFLFLISYEIIKRKNFREQRVHKGAACSQEGIVISIGSYRTLGISIITAATGSSTNYHQQ